MMSAMLETRTQPVPQYAGLRMSSDEYHALEDDGFKYELVNGVVILSPSPRPKHQAVLMEIAFQLKLFLRDHAVGAVYPETDVRFDAETTYRPELVFIPQERVRKSRNRITDAPDMVLEVVSPENRRYDAETKKTDYERFGVREYWLIDPERATMTFLRLMDGRYHEVTAQGARYVSEAVPGFALEPAPIRAEFETR